MKKLWVFGGVVLMATSSFVIAENMAKGCPGFASFDVNSDAVISKQEATGRMLRHFDQLDLDADNAISEDEFDKMKANRKGCRRGAHFANLDTDNDGFISKEEAKGRLLTNFDKIDRDNDGKISAQELQQVRNKHRNNQHNKRPTFETLDSNADGMISKEEFEAHQQRSHMTKDNKHNQDNRHNKDNKHNQ